MINRGIAIRWLIIWFLVTIALFAVRAQELPRLEPIDPIGKVEWSEGDDAETTITVYELKNIEATVEDYDNLIVLYNQMVPLYNRVASMYEGAMAVAEDSTELGMSLQREVEELRRWKAFGVGVIGAGGAMILAKVVVVPVLDYLAR